MKLLHLLFAEENFWVDNWYFFAGGAAIVILVAILIFMRMRRPNE